MSLRRGFWIGLAAFALSSGSAFAQGATGGSLGNDNKSLSGASEPRSAAPARRERAEPRATPKREAAPRRREAAPQGGDVAKFDGTWSVTSVGETCSDTATVTVMIANGQLTSANDIGTISANGVSSSVGNYGGIRVTAQGRNTGTAGSGRFQRSDGCVGRWTSVKQ